MAPEIPDVMVRCSYRVRDDTGAWLLCMGAAYHRLVPVEDPNALLPREALPPAYRCTEHVDRHTDRWRLADELE